MQIDPALIVNMKEIQTVAEDFLLNCWKYQKLRLQHIPYLPNCGLKGCGRHFFCNSGTALHKQMDFLHTKNEIFMKTYLCFLFSILSSIYQTSLLPDYIAGLQLKTGDSQTGRPWPLVQRTVWKRGDFSCPSLITLWSEQLNFCLVEVNGTPQFIRTGMGSSKVPYESSIIISAA